MSGRPWPAGKQGYAVKGVVRAVPLDALSDFCKLLWLESWELWMDAEACYVSAASMAQRLGCSLERVEKARVLLLSVELLRRTVKPGRRSHSWLAVVPDAFEPKGLTPKASEIQEAGARLGSYLKQRRTAHTPLTPADQPQHWRTAHTPLASEANSPSGVQTLEQRRMDTPTKAYRPYAAESLESRSDESFESQPAHTEPKTEAEQPRQRLTLSEAIKQWDYQALKRTASDVLGAP